MDPYLEAYRQAPARTLSAYNCYAIVNTLCGHAAADNVITPLLFARAPDIARVERRAAELGTACLRSDQLFWITDPYGTRPSPGLPRDVLASEIRANVLQSYEILQPYGQRERYRIRRTYWTGVPRRRRNKV